MGLKLQSWLRPNAQFIVAAVKTVPPSGIMPVEVTSYLTGFPSASFPSMWTQASRWKLGGVVGWRA
jgi:hypothetical protein